MQSDDYMENRIQESSSLTSKEEYHLQHERCEHSRCQTDEKQRAASAQVAIIVHGLEPKRHNLRRASTPCIRSAARAHTIKKLHSHLCAEHCIPNAKVQRFHAGKPSTKRLVRRSLGSNWQSIEARTSTGTPPRRSSVSHDRTPAQLAHRL